MIVADTDVLIDFLAGREPAADRVAAELDTGGLRTTVVTRFELLSGARSGGQEAVIRQLLEAIPALGLDEAGGDRAAAVRRDLDASGQRVAMADCLIAGIALRHGASLLTNNRRQLERVEGLILEEMS